MRPEASPGSLGSAAAIRLAAMLLDVALLDIGRVWFGLEALLRFEASALGSLPLAGRPWRLGAPTTTDLPLLVGPRLRHG